MGNDWAPVAVILVILEVLTGLAVAGMFLFALLERKALRGRPYSNATQAESGHERIETRVP